MLPQRRNPNRMNAPLSSYVNCPCEIKSEKNVLLATGLLAGFYNNELVIRDQRCTLALAHYNRPVKVYLHGADLSGCELMGKVYISTNSFMRIKDIQMLTGRERRNCFRLAVDLEGIVCRASEICRAQSINRLREMNYAKEVEKIHLAAAAAGRELTKEELEQRVPKPKLRTPLSYPAKIADLGAGGLKLISKESFRRHERLIVRLELLNKSAELSCLTVRESAKCKDSPFKIVGCKFEDVTSRQNNLLCSYLLQEQGRQIRKSKRV